MDQVEYFYSIGPVTYTMSTATGAALAALFWNICFPNFISALFFVNQKWLDINRKVVFWCAAITVGFFALDILFWNSSDYPPIPAKFIHEEKGYPGDVYLSHIKTKMPSYYVYEVQDKSHDLYLIPTTESDGKPHLEIFLHKQPKRFRKLFPWSKVW